MDDSIDSGIRRELWESKIAIEFQFIASELSIIDKPKPIFLLVSRIGYLPLVGEKLQKYINSIISDAEIDEIWFEYNGVPLKWYYPIGVLVDCLQIDDSYPWAITVHVKNFPEDEIMHCQSKDIVEATFIQTIKEADQIKHKGRVIEEMTKEDHKKLWSSLANDRCEQFWSVNRKLMEDSLDKPMKDIPVRLYQAEHLNFVQKSIKPVKDNDEKTTVEDVLRQIYPNIFENISNYCVITLGIDVPLETTVSWLSQNMCYPDNFVHLCICSTTTRR